MKNKPKAFLKFNYTDNTSTTIELSKVTVLNMPLKQVAFHLDKLPDGKYLMLANIEILPDDKKLDNITVIRETEK